jgi:diguanylate cyclase (GGDEF)-like protein
MVDHHNLYYLSEKRHARNRFIFLIIVTVLSFLFFSRTGVSIIPSMILACFVLSSLTIVSFIHYAFIRRYPERYVSFRKQFIILIDLVSLAFLISIFQKYGIFLLPLYIWIVMWSASSYGIDYFPSGIISSVISWALLLIYSPYWKAHFDIVLTFALTTLFIPLYYLRVITRISEENLELSKILSSTTQDANYDLLTGLANRKMYHETIYSALKKRESFALFFIDLNKFKNINDTYGHHIGDKVLQEVAQRLQSCMSEDDFLARLGGDEFVIISKRKKAFLAKFLERIERTVMGIHKIDHIRIPIELSIGISLYPDDSKEEMQLGRYADDAMYAAKKAVGKYHIYYHELKQEKQ